MEQWSDHYELRLLVLTGTMGRSYVTLPSMPSDVPRHVARGLRGLPCALCRYAHLCTVPAGWHGAYMSASLLYKISQRNQLVLWAPLDMPCTMACVLPRPVLRTKAVDVRTGRV